MDKDRRKNRDGSVGRRETDDIRIDHVAEKLLIESEQFTRRIRRLTGLGFTLLGFIFIISALGFFFGDSTRQSVVSQQLSDTFEFLWSCVWLFGGVCLVIGTQRPNFIIELIGHYAVLVGIITYAVAVIVAVGFAPTFYLALIIVVFVSLRIYFLLVYANRLTYILKDADVLGL